MKPMRWLSVVLLIVFVAAAAFAGTTGKIAGKVTDKQTGEPLPGVNVIVAGTNLGAATNIDGEFVILNVPPGTYTVNVDLIGYNALEVKGVVVQLDLTSTLDQELTPTTIEMGTITVEAERPLIEKDVTSSRMRITPSQITSSAITGLINIVNINPGSQLGSFRGGRIGTGEVVYLLDGISVSNPLGAAFQPGTGAGSQDYANRESDDVALATYIPDEAIAEAEVLTGGFGAEYPSVQSAVVNVVGKEGGRTFSGKFKSKSAPEVIFGRSYWGDGVVDPQGRQVKFAPSYDASGNVTSWDWADNPYFDKYGRSKLYSTRQHDWSFGGPVPLTSVDVPGEMSFFTSGTYAFERNPYNTGFSDKYYSVQGKLTYNISSSKRLTVSGLTSNAKFNRRTVSDTNQERDLNLSWGNQTYFSGPVYYQDVDGVWTHPPDLQWVADYWTRVTGTPTTVNDIAAYYMDTPLGVDTIYQYTSFFWIIADGHTQQQADSLFFSNLNEFLGTPDSITSYPTDAYGYPVPFDPSLDDAVVAAVDSVEAAGWARSYESYDMAQSVLRQESWSDEVSVRFTNNLSPRSFYNVTLSRFHTAKEGRTHDPWDDHPLSHEEMLDNRFLSTGTNEFLTFFVNPMHLGRRYTTDDRQTVYTVKADITSQVNNNNLMKMGFDYRKFDLFKDQTQIASGGNEYTDIFKVKPYQIGVYAQNKLESEGMILNVGLRFDFFDPKTWVPSNASDPLLQEFALDPNNLGGIFDLEHRLKGPVRAKSKQQLSPRVGMSFPVTERDVLHVTYGHYFQLPMFDYFYNNHGYDLRGAFKYIGNPDLEEEKTIAYEAGLEHGFNDYLKLSVTGFFKDISNLVSFKKIAFGAGQMYIRTNRDFARVKGFEVSMSQRPWHNVSGLVTYTYQIARGRASDAYQSFLDDYRNRKPRTEDYPLDTDQRHTARANVNYQIPTSWGPAVSGYHFLGDWGFDFFFTYGSGIPFTSAVNVPQPEIPDINGENLPKWWRIDVRVDKGFQLYRSLASEFFVEVRNLTDRADIEEVNDVQRYELFGEPGGQFGDPTVYSAGRRILMGMQVTF